MQSHYTHTTWRVKPGREDEFIRRWNEWAEWSHRQGLDAPALLLRDVENPETFVSFGQWASAAAVRSWRALDGYQERVAPRTERLPLARPLCLCRSGPERLRVFEGVAACSDGLSYTRAEPTLEVGETPFASGLLGCVME